MDVGRPVEEWLHRCEATVAWPRVVAVRVVPSGQRLDAFAGTDDRIG